MGADFDKMNIEQVTYNVFEGQRIGMMATIDGERIGVPLVPGNRHHDEIMRQVAAGELTIADPSED